MNKGPEKGWSQGDEVSHPAEDKEILKSNLNVERMVIELNECNSSAGLKGSL